MAIDLYIFLGDSVKHAKEKAKKKMKLDPRIPMRLLFLQTPMLPHRADPFLAPAQLPQISRTFMVTAPPESIY